MLNFIENKEELFDKVVCRRYDCSDSIQLVTYNLKLHTIGYLENLSAELFEIMYCNNILELERFIKKNKLEDEFSGFIDELIKEKVLNNGSNIIPQENPVNLSNVEDNQSITDFYEKLYENDYIFNLHIDITKKCNLRCKHCYHPFEEYSYENELDLWAIKKVVDEAYDMGVFCIILSGGEPLLRDDILEIIQYISFKGMCIDLFTNATLIDKEFINEIKKYNINNISISIYSDQEQTHDNITQVNGSYKKTKWAIEQLHNSGLQIELKAVMMQDNFEDYKSLDSYAKGIGCKLILDTSMTPKLNSDSTPIDLALSYEQYLSLCLDSESSYYIKRTSEMDPNERACNAGRFGLYCDSEGNYYPCVSFQMNLGSINTGLRNAWNNSNLKKWGLMKNKDYLGYNKHSYCKFCLEICAGIAQLENGDYTNCEKSDCYKARARQEAFEAVKEEGYYEKTKY